MAEFTEDELAAESATDETQFADPPAQEQPRDERGQFARKEGDEEQGEGDERDDGRLPPNAYKAVKGEREAHKQTKEQLRQAQEQLRQIAELRARLANPPQEEAPRAAPDEDDPTGINYLRQQVERLDGSLRQRDAREQEAIVGQHENALLFGQLNSSESEFRARQPDYDQAALYLAQARSRELEMYGLQPHQIKQQLQEEVLEITRTAIQLERNPAELAYAIAQTRGYQPQQQQNGGGNPMFEAINRGQKGRSLSSARGGGGSADPNFSAIANMSDEEFARNMKDPKFAALVEQLG